MSQRKSIRHLLLGKAIILIVFPIIMREILKLTKIVEIKVSN